MRELVHNLSSNERQLRQTRSLIFPCLSGPPFQFYIHKGILKEDWSTVLPMLSNPIFVCLFFYACTYIHTFHKISQLVVRAICEGPPTTYIQSADHMSRCACNLNRSSSVCGEEAGQGDEYAPDRTEFEVFYDAVEKNKPLQVCVWRKQASSLRCTTMAETHIFSQRFLEANAIIIQTFWRLWRTGVPPERRHQSHRLLFHIGQIESCKSVHIHAQIHTYIHTKCPAVKFLGYIHTYICVYIHMYIHTYIHTYIH